MCVCSVGLMLFSVGGEGEGEMIFFLEENLYQSGEKQNVFQCFRGWGW